MSSKKRFAVKSNKRDTRIAATTSNEEQSTIHSPHKKQKRYHTRDISTKSKEHYIVTHDTKTGNIADVKAISTLKSSSGRVINILSTEIGAVIKSYRGGGTSGIGPNARSKQSRLSENSKSRKK